MKRLILLIAATLACLTVSAQRIVTVGPVVGASISKMDKPKLENRSGWRAGLTCKVKLPVYFTIQPSVIFNQSFCNAQTEVLSEYVGYVADVRQDQVEIPVAVQWGPDLGFFRPFVEVVPFMNFTFSAKDKQIGSVLPWVNATQFGFGLGGGLEIWKFQLSARYNWEMADWAKDIEDNPFGKLNGRRGMTVIQVAFLF